MSQEQQRNFIKWSARKKTFDWGWESLSVGIYLPDLLRLPMTSKGYVNIKIASKKSWADEYGNTHSIYEDDYDPNGTKSPNRDGIILADKMEWKASSSMTSNDNVDDDLPF